MTAAYGQWREDEVSAIWRASAQAEAGPCVCPMCGAQMVTTTIGAGAAIKVEVCREDELFWLDAGVIPQLPKSVPAPSPAPASDDASKIEAVRQTFAAGLEGGRLHEKRGFFSRVSDSLNGRGTAAVPAPPPAPSTAPVAPTPPEPTPPAPTADAPSDQLA